MRAFARPSIAAAIAVLAFAGCQGGPPAFTEAQVLGGVSVPAEILNHGQRLYMRSCASCHAADGSGRGPAARSLRPGPRDFRTGDFLYKSTPEGALPTDEDIAITIRNGRLERGMPSWRGMQETDIKALVQFIKTFSPRWREAPAAAGTDQAASEPAPSRE